MPKTDTPEQPRRIQCTVKVVSGRPPLVNGCAIELQPGDIVTLLEFWGPEEASSCDGKNA